MFEQGVATVLLGARGRLVRALRALLDAVLLLRGDSVLHAPSTLVDQDDAGFVVGLLNIRGSPAAKVAPKIDL